MTYDPNKPDSPTNVNPNPANVKPNPYPYPSDPDPGAPYGRDVHGNPDVAGNPKPRP